MQIITKLTLSS